MKKVIIRVVALAILLGGGWWAYAFLRSLPQSQEQIATAKVRRGDVVVRSYTRGELRATRSVTLTAPNLFGTVQVTRLAPLGSFAHEKDLIVEYDDSEVTSRVEEDDLSIEQTDQQIKKAEADLAVQSNQDQVDLLTAQFDVRRAELEVKRNDLLAAIDAKKNVLTLEEAQRRLKQLESDIQSRRLQAKAQLAVLQETKNKGLLQLQQEKTRLSQVKMLAPMSGLVAIRQTRPNFYFPGMQIPDIREGDQINPGLPVADVLDLSELEIIARVGELDRANLHEGQDATIQLDAIPGQKLNAKIKSMSGTATANVFSSDPAKKFDVVFSLDMPQLFRVLGVKPEQIKQILAIAEMNKRIHPQPAMPPPMMKGPGGPPPPSAPQGAKPATAGSTSMATATAKPPAPTSAMPAPMVMGPQNPAAAMMGMSAPQFSEADRENAKLPPAPEENSQFEVLLRPGLLADVEIVIDKVPNAIYIPNQAVFDKEGKMVAYVKHGNQFEARAFKPLKRSESVMIVSDGLQPGDVIALADPTAKKEDNKKGKTGAAGPLGALPGKGAK
ncbi:MAG TPA: efflux RND transporter periplasmic adaptor subunit [Bryobacteraceae bacterium]|nr:efflux RND transporter periplasmic adaptor subunit [Bryobacteraceae bacterium]